MRGSCLTQAPSRQACAGPSQAPALCQLHVFYRQNCSPASVHQTLYPPLAGQSTAAAHRATLLQCRASVQPQLPADELASGSKNRKFRPEEGSKVKEAHKIFDEVNIVVRSGDGGQGEIVASGTGRWVTNLKYKPGGNMRKQIWLPASDPADGADGADVVLVCDPNYDSLLHLHKRKEYKANKGANGNPAVGSGGPKNNKAMKKAVTPPLEIPVPPGTVVKRKGTGALLGELLRPGERLVVAYGGRGGTGVIAPSREKNQRDAMRQERAAMSSGAEVVTVEDNNWKADSKGEPGKQLGLNLLLRVVADVGLVGFPNAGKSSLLMATTRATPEVAPYPFTTLMPNLGVLSAGQGTQKAVMADLPGLIEGAHKGKGLGRNFLRHLRRTRALLHVVDASAPDPVTDYYAVREELRMYNPEYCGRPHVVALNKFDKHELQGREKEIADALMAVARQHQADWKAQAWEGPKPSLPTALVPCSALTGQGLPELAKAIQKALGQRTAAELDHIRPDVALAAAAAFGVTAGGAAEQAAAASAAPISEGGGQGQAPAGAGDGDDKVGDEDEDDFIDLNTLSEEELRMLAAMEDLTDFIELPDEAAMEGRGRSLSSEAEAAGGDTSSAFDHGRDQDAEPRQSGAGAGRDSATARVEYYSTASSGSSGVRGGVSEPSPAGVDEDVLEMAPAGDPDVVRLMDLSDEELLALADQAEPDDMAPKGFM